jgi:patatin-like phospholipase/acyl hydrolase
MIQFLCWFHQKSASLGLGHKNLNPSLTLCIGNLSSLVISMIKPQNVQIDSNIWDAQKFQHMINVDMTKANMW